MTLLTLAILGVLAFCAIGYIAVLWCVLPYEEDES